MVRAGLFPVERDAKAHRFAIHRGRQHQMQIASVKSERNLTLRRICSRGFLCDRPRTCHGPLIQLERSRNRIPHGVITRHGHGRGEVFGASVADIGLRRAHGAVVGGALHALAFHGAGDGRQSLGTRLGEQLPQGGLGLVIVSFAEMVAANATLRVDEVVRRPVFVVERPPDAIAVVDGHRVFDAEIVNGTLHVVLVFLEREFG